VAIRGEATALYGDAVRWLPQGRDMRPFPHNTILTGDAATALRNLPEASVDCVITSPPCCQLRDYGAAGQLGLEDSVQDWVAGTSPGCARDRTRSQTDWLVWLNLGDSFIRHDRYGAPPKAPLVAPERLLVALMVADS
jgi:site-specific DNA-methyltransferase (adenine-specific)